MLAFLFTASGGFFCGGCFGILLGRYAERQHRLELDRERERRV